VVSQFRLLWLAARDMETFAAVWATVTGERLCFMSHCRSAAETSVSGRDVKHYSGDQFDSASDEAAVRPTTDNCQTSGKPQLTDQVSSGRQDEVKQHSANNEPTVSSSHSGSVIMS